MSLDQTKTCEILETTTEDSDSDVDVVRTPYLKLLNTLASDLDFMLNDLYSNKPSSREGNETFLEPYIQGVTTNDSGISSQATTTSTTTTTAFVKKRLEYRRHGLGEDAEMQADSQQLLFGKGSFPSPSSPSPPSTGAMEKNHEQFRLVEINAGSQTSLTRLITDEECSEGTSSNGGSSGECNEEETPCDITLLERLIRSHPIWFLPGIQRAGAFHLLQGKEDGNFVVRQSSQTSTMAISVRLPSGKGPYIEHYLISAMDGQLGLESSDNKFGSIPLLIAHYCQCCDELPVQLTLPKAIRDARNRQQLSSLALLGQEFWRYPMANGDKCKLEEESSTPFREENRKIPPAITSMLPSSSSNSPASSLSSFEGNNGTVAEQGFGLESNLKESPKSMMSTFKGLSPVSGMIPHNQIGIPVCPSECPSSLPIEASQMRTSRPTPPSSLNLMSTTLSACRSPDSGIPTTTTSPCIKTPPPPPPRWTKPSPCTVSSSSQQNFTVTTTLTFTVNKTSPPPSIQVNEIKVCPLEGNSNTSPSALLQTRSQVTSPISPLSQCSSTQPLSPVSEGNARPFHKRSSRRKRESKHYQESDVTYHRSAVADKASDYEDIWVTEGLVTFKPPEKGKGEAGAIKPPDIIEKLVSPDGGNNHHGNRFGVVFNANISITEMPEDGNAEKENEERDKNQPDKKEVTDKKENEKGSNICDKKVVDGNLASPFYAEPADALLRKVNRRVKADGGGGKNGKNRHSDPASFHQWPPIASSTPLERIDSKEELITLSSSVDNLAGLRLSKRSRVGHSGGKVVEPPKVNLPKKFSKNASWMVDSSWEFFAKEGIEENGREGNGEEIGNDYHSRRDFVTVRQIIAERLPELQLSPAFCRLVNGDDNDGDKSDHSDKEKVYYNGLSILSQLSDASDDTRTEFSEPWDSVHWENLFAKTSNPFELGETSTATTGCKTFKERLDPLLSPPRLKALANKRASAAAGDEGNAVPGAAIREYALHLASDKSTVFSKSIENFIACTKESKEVKPQVVMRNMRQFMSGMKNYLVKHGEGEFENEVDRERAKLKSTEFLNLDAILESVMHKLVVTPLKDHLYKLFVDEYVDSGAIQQLSESMQYARTKPMAELGIREKIIPPGEEDLRKIFQHFDSLQAVDSPLEKLENLLAAIAAIFHSVKVSNKTSLEPLLLGADDFLPVFVWVLVQSGMIAAEIEAEYMWGLLHSSLLSGEGGYYLTTLSSAVNVLKNFRDSPSREPRPDVPWCHDPLSEFRSVLKVVVPDELNGSLLTKTLPVRLDMTTRDICKIIALKLRITNPQDYSLFKLVDGEETSLNDSDCPQDVKSEITSGGKHCIFAYKRSDAKIAWPRTTSIN